MVGRNPSDHPVRALAEASELPRGDMKPPGDCPNTGHEGALSCGGDRRGRASKVLGRGFFLLRERRGGAWELWGAGRAREMASARRRALWDGWVPWALAWWGVDSQEAGRGR